MAPLVTLLMVLFLSSGSILASRSWTTNGTLVQTSPNSLVLPEVGLLKYHMGPVLSPQISVHLIWYGNWQPAKKRIIREFISSISASDHQRSPSVFEWWKTVRQYADQTASNVSGKILLGKEKNDRLMSHGRTLTRLSVQSVIGAAIRAKTNPLPVHPRGGLYLVLTADDVLVQDFCVAACGFHYFTFASIVGYTLPFAWVGNSAKMCPDMCAFPYVVPAYMHGIEPVKPPNGDVGVDAMVSVIAHEIAELATNPLINAWYAGDDPMQPTEVGDLCEGIYGNGGGSGYIGQVLRDPNSAVYNMYGIRRRFLVQWVWDHLAARCYGPYVG